MSPLDIPYNSYLSSKLSYFNK